MDRYFFTNESLVILLLVFYQGSTLLKADRENCGKTRNLTRLVEVGENLHIREEIDMQPYYSGDFFIWRRLGGNETAGCYVQTKRDGQLRRYTMSCISYVGNLTLKTYDHCLSYYCNIDIHISKIALKDSGIYVFQTRETICTLLMVHISVRKTNPLCSAALQLTSNALQLSCEWIQLQDSDTVWVVLKNRTLYEYKNYAEGDGKGNSSLSISIPLNEGLCGNPAIPDSCILSQFGVKKSCKFNTLMPSKLKTFKDNNIQIDFIQVLYF